MTLGFRFMKPLHLGLCNDHLVQERIVHGMSVPGDVLDGEGPKVRRQVAALRHLNLCSGSTKGSQTSIKREMQEHPGLKEGLRKPASSEECTVAKGDGEHPSPPSADPNRTDLRRTP